MQLIHSSFGRYSDCTDEQGCLAVDDDVKELIKLTIGIIVLRKINGLCPNNALDLGIRWFSLHFHRLEAKVDQRRKAHSCPRGTTLIHRWSAEAPLEFGEGRQ